MTAPFLGSFLGVSLVNKGPSMEHQGASVR
jgi:hypothetical protein